MNRVLERVSVDEMIERRPRTLREKSSMAAYGKIARHGYYLRKSLGVGSRDHFRVSPPALMARQKHLEWAKNSGHETGRDIHQLSNLLTGLGLHAVKQFEAEFAGQDVLDIGCGEGRFGEAIARNGKARVTFLDKDEAIMNNIVPSSRKKKVVGDGRSLAFEDESFDKTVSAFSAVYWAPTPVDTIKALNEALRVTKVGGTCFLIPAFSSLKLRHHIASIDFTTANLRKGDPEVLADPRVYKMWDLQDFVVLQGLLHLEKTGHCSLTWGGYVLEGKTLGETLEHYSVMIDVEKPIPKRMLTNNLAFARRFSRGKVKE